MSNGLYLILIRLSIKGGDFMENKLLVFLEAIQQHNSMTKAAQSLFISQPYISRTIKSAETHFGTPLIDRGHHPLELTYAGERLLTYLQSDARLHQRMNTELKEISQNKYQSMTIGITPPMANAWFSQTLPAFYQRFPNIRTKILEITTSKAETLLASHQLDFFIGKTIHQTNVKTIPLQTISLSLVIPKTAGIYQSNQFWRPFTPTILTGMTGEPVIRAVGEARFQELVDHYFADKGIQTIPLIEVDNSRFALSLTLQGLGSIVLATAMLAKLATEPAKYPINAFKLPTSELSLDFSIAYLPSHVLAKPIAYLVEQACQTFNPAIDF